MIENYALCSLIKIYYILRRDRPGPSIVQSAEDEIKPGTKSKGGLGSGLLILGGIRWISKMYPSGVTTLCISQG